MNVSFSANSDWLRPIKLGWFEVGSETQVSLTDTGSLASSGLVPWLTHSSLEMPG